MGRTNWNSDHPTTCNCRECTSRRLRRQGTTPNRSGENPANVDPNSDEYKRTEALLTPSPIALEECPTCEGRGNIMSRWDTIQGGKLTRCPTCFGKGKVDQNHPLLKKSIAPVIPTKQPESETLDWDTQLSDIDVTLPDKVEPKIITKKIGNERWRRISKSTPTIACAYIAMPNAICRAQKSRPLPPPSPLLTRKQTVGLFGF